MVVIHGKRLPTEEHSKDYDEFLWKCSNDTNVGEATDAVQRVQNMRVQLKWMSASAKELAKDCADNEDMSTLLLQVAAEADRYLDLSRIDAKMPSTEDELTKLTQDIKGAVIMAFPEQCSGTDAQQRLVAVLDGDAAGEKERGRAHRILACIDDQAKTPEIMQGQAVMWWAGKCLNRAENFTKYVGKMEKTKIIVKLSVDTEHAPPREAAIDAKTQNEMMAYWYKKQEEQKKLIEDDDISYANSEWADSHGLKGQLQGMGGVKYRP